MPPHLKIVYVAVKKKERWNVRQKQTKKIDDIKCPSLPTNNSSPLRQSVNLAWMIKADNDFRVVK